MEMTIVNRKNIRQRKKIMQYKHDRSYEGI